MHIIIIMSSPCQVSKVLVLELTAECLRPKNSAFTPSWSRGATVTPNEMIEKDTMDSTHVMVFTAYIGSPVEVLNAGRSILPRSSARVSNTGSPESEYAESNPPR